ncbi:hypothetical protein ACSMXN_06890 [Jatrophihabitans sp. DSM 45814]
MTLTTQAEALFVSSLQPSDQPTIEQITAAIELSLQTHGGVSGCVDVFAAQYGAHPDEAADRMRWALSLATVSIENVGRSGRWQNTRATSNGSNQWAAASSRAA